MNNKLKTMEKLWKPLIMMLLLPLAFINVGFASPDATYKVVPTNSVGTAGQTFDVDVYGYDLSGVYAWQVYMEWDQAALYATDVVIPGWLESLPSYRIRNDVNPSYMFGGETLTSGMECQSSDVVLLCTVTFKVLSETPTTLNITGYVGGIWLTYYQCCVDYPNKHIPEVESGYYIGAPWPEDINGDGWVDIFDLSSVAIHYGEEGSPGWIPEDLWGEYGEPDGAIDIWDLTRVCIKYGLYAGY
jgi:hypothetical protein